jgi:hypothetical protein
MEFPNSLFGRMSESSKSYIVGMHVQYPATVDLVIQDLMFNEFIFKLKYETIMWLGGNLLSGRYDPTAIYSLFEKEIEEEVGS